MASALADHDVCVPGGEQQLRDLGTLKKLGDPGEARILLDRPCTDREPFQDAATEVSERWRCGSFLPCQGVRSNDGEEREVLIESIASILSLAPAKTSSVPVSVCPAAAILVSVGVAAALASSAHPAEVM